MVVLNKLRANQPGPYSYPEQIHHGLAALSSYPFALTASPGISPVLGFSQTKLFVMVCDMKAPLAVLPAMVARPYTGRLRGVRCVIFCFADFTNLSVPIRSIRV